MYLNTVTNRTVFKYMSVSYIIWQDQAWLYFIWFLFDTSGLENGWIVSIYYFYVVLVKHMKTLQKFNGTMWKKLQGYKYFYKAL